MSIELLVACFLAGFVYVVSPGPAFLALFTLTAAKGRRQGARFITAHLLGDTVWSAAALAAIVGVSQLGSTLFDILGVVCGAYLVYLGIRAIRHRGGGETQVIGAERPARTGLIFGLTNPKAYPVALAMFTALTAPYADKLGWGDAPALIGAAFLGFVLADVLLVSLAGLPGVRRVFLRHEVIITRLTGALFVAFGAKSLADVAMARLRG